MFSWLVIASYPERISDGFKLLKKDDDDANEDDDEEEEAEEEEEEAEEEEVVEAEEERRMVRRWKKKKRKKKKKKRKKKVSTGGDLRLLDSPSGQGGARTATERSLQISGRIRYPLCYRCRLFCGALPPNFENLRGNVNLAIQKERQDADGGARSRDRRVPADLRADPQATVPPTPWGHRKRRRSKGETERQQEIVIEKNVKKEQQKQEGEKKKTASLPLSISGL
ncbi:hypothetical protein PoB_000934600 [Plakobranchus ocellatus]|uniref:Uncharacterized protein n=1 Tax=Plakobranchus ocellatus TaxID=259542 RepID=A0AAV3YKD0_9GAST|nr:hypothetical protein PoB_000934600 [Plakobranchus ocellatus]